MKKKNIPQDDTHLTTFTREVVYAQNEEGKYEKSLSKGWNVKNQALENAWDSINEEVKKAEEKVLNNKKSPIYYFMHAKIMNIKILSSYTGIWKWQVKRHLKPKIFMKLKKSTLLKYADVFDITLDD